MNRDESARNIKGVMGNNVPNMIKINIGSKNKAKITAISEILSEYPHLSQAEIQSMESASGVSNQPKSLEETVRGAVNRAKNCFRNCDYSIGIESG